MGQPNTFFAQEPGGHEVEEAYICLKGKGYIYLNGKKQVRKYLILQRAYNSSYNSSLK